MATAGSCENGPTSANNNSSAEDTENENDQSQNKSNFKT